MFFFKSEINDLIELFPYKKASLESDFEKFELDTIAGFDSLKQNGHYYLGKAWIYIRGLILISDTRLRFFPHKNTLGSEIVEAHTAYITVYYEKGNFLEDVLEKIIDTVHPNYKILIGKNSI